MSRGPGKYFPLQAYLATQSGDRVVLTFAELAAVIGASLPPAARLRSFWANRQYGSVQARAWLTAGWQTAAVDIPQRVTFVRRGVRP